MSLHTWHRQGPRKPNSCADRQLQEAQAKTDRAVIPAVAAVHVPAHLEPPESLEAKQLRHLHDYFHWGRATRGKKSCIYVHRVSLAVSNFLRPCRLWPARFLCQGGAPGKNTGVYWSILVAISF